MELLKKLDLTPRYAGKSCQAILGAPRGLVGPHSVSFKAFKQWHDSAQSCDPLYALCSDTLSIPFSRVLQLRMWSLLAAHPWVAHDGVASDRPLDSAVLQRLKQFSAANKLKRVALKVTPNSCVTMLVL